MPVLYLLDVPEFRPAAAALEREGACRVSRAGGYIRFEADEEIVVERAATGMTEAVWFGLTVAGFEGAVAEYSDHAFRLVRDEGGSGTKG